MAVSQSALTFLAKHPCAPAIDFTFDVPVVQVRKEQGQIKLIHAKTKMSEAQIRVHEAALVTISQWLTTLCTPTMVPLAGANLPIETCIRFICAHTLRAPECVQHLTDKFITDASKLALSSQQVTKLVKSCRGDDDPLLISLADELIGKKFDGQIATTQLDIFLCAAGNELLKKKVKAMEKEMGFKIKDTGSNVRSKVHLEAVASPSQTASEKDLGRLHETKYDGETDVGTDIVEADADGWQILPSASGGGTHSKRQKTTHRKHSA
jgi:hypothetical protein